MHSAKQTLAIVALTTTLVGCSCIGSVTPASTPTLPSESLRLYATTATARLALDLNTAYTETQPRITFENQVSNYQVNYNQLINENTPYFLTNHLPADSPLWGAPIGQDGIAIITNPNVDISDLTVNQLRDVFNGRIVTWDSFGVDNGERIIVVSREDGSGTRAEFERLVMGTRATTPNAIIASSSDNMIQTIANTPNSIGYVSLNLLLNTTALDRVNVLRMNGIEITQETVANNQYPLRSTIYIVGLQEPGEAYRAFIAWIQSPEGQAIVAQNYAPLVTP